MTEQNGASEKINEVAQEVGQELRELGRELRGRANDVRKETVKQLNTAAEGIRKEARDRTKDKDIHQRADEVATGLEKAAQYLNNHSVEDVSKQATKAVKRNPMQALTIVFVLGLVIGLLLRGDKN